ncbi:MAG TPA: Flp family type IVb pilin [Bryobacteraceae bacterium]|nr:Flp family type IVb pilin [Bryobacteraceae bacterium]
MIHTWTRLVSQFAKDRRGQDLIEYAMLAAFVAMAAGAIFPTTLMPNVSTIFSKINSIISQSNTFG